MERTFMLKIIFLLVLYSQESVQYSVLRTLYKRKLEVCKNVHCDHPTWPYKDCQLYESKHGLDEKLGINYDCCPVYQCMNAAGIRVLYIGTPLQKQQTSSSTIPTKTTTASDSAEDSTDLPKTTEAIHFRNLGRRLQLDDSQESDTSSSKPLLPSTTNYKTTRKPPTTYTTMSAVLPKPTTPTSKLPVSKTPKLNVDSIKRPDTTSSTSNLFEMLKQQLHARPVLLRTQQILPSDLKNNQADCTYVVNNNDGQITCITVMESA